MKTCDHRRGLGVLTEDDARRMGLLLEQRTARAARGAALLSRMHCEKDGVEETETRALEAALSRVAKGTR